METIMPVSNDDFLRLVQLAADYLKAEAKNHPFKPSFVLSVEHQDLFGIILRVAKLFIRTRRDPNVGDRVCQQLQAVKCPEPGIQHALVILESLKQELYNVPSIGYLPLLQGLRWRVDITISSSVLSRVLEPTIFMEIELDSKEKVTFEVPISRFHKLRYSTACVLRKLESVENVIASVPV